MNHPSFKMFNESSTRAKDLPVDCICYIYNLLKMKSLKENI